MKLFVIFFAILALSAAARPGLRAKFNVGLRPGTDFFYDIPRHIDDAIAKAWRQVARPEGPLPTLVMHCAEEMVICALYDPASRFVAGVQVALSLKEFTNNIYDWDVQGFVSWTPPTADGSEPVEYKTKSMFFISEETMMKSPEERILQAKADEVLTEGAVWVQGFNKELLRISTSADEIESNSDFTKQACIPWMGRHYYYKMSEDLTCSENTLLNWFPLVHSGKLVAMGFLSIGVLPEKDGQKFWFERPPRLAVQGIVPRGPDCLYELADNPTLTTMHIYFVDQPWLLGCLFQ